jgi:hypothetical protein
LKRSAPIWVLSAVLGFSALAGTPLHAGGTANGGVPTELVPETGTTPIAPAPLPQSQPLPSNCRYVAVGAEYAPSRTVMATGFGSNDCCCGVDAFGVPITIPGGVNRQYVLVCD